MQQSFYTQTQKAWSIQSIWITAKTSDSSSVHTKRLSLTDSEIYKYTDQSGDGGEVPGRPRLAASLGALLPSA